MATLGWIFTYVIAMLAGAIGGVLGFGYLGGVRIDVTETTVEHGVGPAPK